MTDLVAPPPHSGRRARRGSIKRCPACRMLRGLCICSLVPALQTRTRLILILHGLEERKTTNTGRLAATCLPNSQIVLRGRAGHVEEGPLPWIEARRPVLLFPAHDAEPIERYRDDRDPVTLVVPDGTWGQARRVRRRMPGLAAIPCVTLPPLGESMYRLRRERHPAHVSTLEAIARALGILEGPAIREGLERIFRIMVERTLWSAGKLAAGEVTGGIPAEALRNLPSPPDERGGGEPL